MAHHTLSPVDAAWFQMDGPANLAVITGLMLTRQPLNFDLVRARYQQQLLKFDRFRQRVTPRGLGLTMPQWEDMPHFNIDQHVHHIALPAPHDHATLTALLNDLASLPLDRSLPLWQLLVVDEVAGGSAVIMRMHHCIADGTAMMAVMQTVFDAERPRRIRASAQAQPSTAANVPTPGWLDEATQFVGGVIGGAGVLVAELLKPGDPPSPLKGEFGLPKRLAWSAPVALASVKAIGAHYGAKVNDVLVAAVTGALRNYLKIRGTDVNHTTLRAMVPVDLRAPGQTDALGNAFGLVILDLAITSARPEQRLALTKARMDALKHSPEANATNLLLNLLGRGPKVLEDMAEQLFGSKVSLVLTNVVGPQTPMSLTGVPIDRMMFWVPHPGDEIGLGVSLMSYRGSVTVAVETDARLVPDPHHITEAFTHEFAAMLATVPPATARKTAHKPVRKTEKNSIK